MEEEERQRPIILSDCPSSRNVAVQLIQSIVPSKKSKKAHEKEAETYGR